MKLLKTLFLASLLLLPTVVLAKANNREDVQLFIRDMVQHHGFSTQRLNSLFNQITIKPATINTSTGKPLEVMTWGKYRSLYLTHARIEEGMNFYQQNQKTLMTVQKEYGVPANIIVGILGAETNYGRSQGNDLVLQTLSNWAFIPNRRSTYFRKELANFLILCSDNDFNPLSIKGSYAGAMGQPQFMPSAWEHYAVSYQHKKRVDLISNEPDVITSIANYLKENGWQAGVPVAFKINVSDKMFARLPEKTFKPIYTVAQLKQFDITLPKNLPTNTTYRFMQLQGSHGMEYWLGTKNFYVITRYNASTDYAMAVYQLAEAVKPKSA